MGVAAFDSTAGSLEGRQSHTDDVLKEEALLTAPHYPLYKLQAKGGMRTGKRRAVAQIMHLYWATVAQAMHRQVPGPETGLDAHQLRHGSDIPT